MERKTERKALAKELEDGRFFIDFGNEDTKELAASTFRRLYTVLEEDVQVETVEEVEPTTEEETEVDETGVTEETPAAETQVDMVEEALGEGALEALLADAQEITEEVDATPEAKPEPAPKPQERAVEELGLGIKLLDWNMSGTRGGKTDKVTSQISIKDYLMEITEYAGYITDVRLFKENPNPPENDPDATWELAYKSPKMSLKDTLEWLGLSEDDAKLARKEITAIRKAVKAAHLEQQAEQEEFDEQESQETEEETVNQ